MPKQFPLHSSGFNPFGALIGLNFESCAEGASRCTIELREDLVNPHGVLHGGVIYSMADTGMGGALYSLLAAEEGCATRRITIKYSRPVETGTVICDTKVLHRRGQLAELDSVIRADSRIVARARGVYAIFKIQSEMVTTGDSK